MAKSRVMQKFLIIAANCVLLVVMLLGVPEVCGVRFWSLEVSSVPIAHTLMFWGLMLAAALNAGAAKYLVKGKKDRNLCWLWAAIFMALVGAEFGYERGWFTFNWLKRALLWMQSKL
jgi:riboflavin transporter FmnP